MRKKRHKIDGSRNGQQSQERCKIVCDIRQQVTHHQRVERQYPVLECVVNVFQYNKNNNDNHHSASSLERHGCHAENAV